MIKVKISILQMLYFSIFVHCFCSTTKYKVRDELEQSAVLIFLLNTSCQFQDSSGWNTNEETDACSRPLCIHTQIWIPQQPIKKDKHEKNKPPPQKKKRRKKSYQPFFYATFQYRRCDIFIFSPWKHKKNALKSCS